MSVKLFGNSKRARLQKGAKKSPEEPKKHKVLNRIIIIFLVIVLVESLYCTAVFSNISVIAHYRTIWIETAMSTLSHQWLATSFIPPAVVKAVTDQVSKAQEAQIGISSAWNQGSKDVPQEPATPVPKEPEEAQMPEDQKAFYELFSEIDQSTMERYIEANPLAVADGWDKVYINEAGLDDEGTDIYTVQGDQVLAIDAKNQIILIRVAGKGYRGILALAKDATRLSVQVSPTLGAYGSCAGEIAEAHNGVLAMTGSSFIDPSGNGSGGILAGYAMCDGVEYGHSHMGWGNKRIELHEDNLMYITDSQSPVSEGTTDAVEFTPALIVDGEILVDENCGWNSYNPRAVIGQAANHDIMMLITEGRQLDAIGTGVVECANILARYDCMQAMNLDGGSSAIMWFDGEYVTRCGNTSLYEGRPLPNAFVFEKAD